MKWKKNPYFKVSINHYYYFQITVSSMDNSAVKQKCRMSLNLPREQSVSETIHVKSKRNSENVDAGFYNPYHGKKISKNY